MRSTTEKQRYIWNPPPKVLKVKIDGAFLMEQKSLVGGIDFIISDKDGAAVMVGAGRLESVHDAFCAQAQTCLAGLTGISAQVMTRIQLESDSFNLVSALKLSAF
jgi:hypothetical protein